ncbi:Man1-Src1p-C-terminal domain-containing protein [Xylaria bambusicola]|uniref:Man1-Src1p-C-terminal domain-containing protein n=1 Tax=Xylaria bambusicola TaxID=326684 RepID=UPI00200845CF|nr:Man1-Src1p-C-terminal domain-containing protein [Xylaria bambusicola]KAI0506103.1 Man1-Src1p-C-terminal domain-containing protein [Xylaria bambusicola]
MSDSENVDYLQPGFDPKSLTIPRLRSILVAHNVPYSSNAKKGQLVEIFNDQILPQSAKILNARARAKRSSKGIFDVESTSSSNPFDDHQDLQPPPPRPATTRRSRSPRKASARIKSEEPDFGPPMPPPAPSSPSKRAARSTSRQAPDTETAPRLDSSAMSGKPTWDATPKLKTEESDGLFRRTSDVFTSDNPFQSGSPAGPEQTPSNRRRTTSHHLPRSSSKGTRRRTDDYSRPDDYDLPHDEQPAAPYSGLEVPKPRYARRKTPEPVYRTPDPPAVEAGEEFTPQEQLELAAEEIVNGQNAVVRAGHESPSKKVNKKTPFLMFLTTMLAVYAGWYRQEKIAVGYCGVGQTVGSIPSEIEVPEWAQSVLPAEIPVPQFVIDKLEPECEPCPAHAYCYDDFTVRCEQDYILKPHPFALGGAVPLPPTCEPDGEKVRRVQAVADKAIEELRERAAKYECREPIDEEGTIVDTPAMEELELKQIIDKKKSRKMSNQEFEDLWGAAIGEIKHREEVQVEVKETSDSGAVPNTFLSSTSLARIPLSCAVRRSIRLGLARHRLQISILIAAIVTAFYGRARFRSHRAAAAKVPSIVDDVLNRLASQKERDDEDDPWLFLPNLRDDVLRATHSLRERERIWQRVIAVVEQNSNVRTGQREGRNGEVGRAWEWIGPTAGDSSSKRRRSGRVSFGPDMNSEDSPSSERSYLHQKWEEPRPVY